VLRSPSCVTWAACAALTAASQVALAYGEPDPTFRPTAVPGWECGDGHSITALDDESAFLWGINFEHSFKGAVIKFLPDGTPDLSWGTGGAAQIADVFSQKLLVPALDKGLYVIGMYNVVLDQVTRLRKDGSVDPAWSWRDDQHFGQVISAALSSGGGLAILGLRQNPLTAVLTETLEVFGPDGGPLNSWNLGQANVYAWSVDSHGNAEIASYTLDGGGKVLPVLQRYSGLQSPEVLSPQRLLPHEGVASWMSASVGVDAMGGVIFFRVNPVDYSMSLIRFNPDGSPDTTFAAGGSRSIPMLTFTLPQPPDFVGPVALWRSPSGAWTALTRIEQLDGGFSIAPLLHHGTHALRFLADGTPDPSFAQFSQVADTIRYVRLDSGKLLRNAFGGNSCGLARELTDDVRVEATMVEYYHPALDHYFMTLDGFEAAILDDNVEKMGWVRTGSAFGAWHPVGLPGTTPACRFYGDPVIGPNSHFYSTKDYECQDLRQIEARTPPGDPVWHFEGYTFSATDAANGQCPPNLTPVYRAFSGAAARANDPHHRYTTDPAIYEELLGKGWGGEGVQFCVPPRPSRTTN
jgi:hypothetical protein